MDTTHTRAVNDGTPKLITTRAGEVVVTRDTLHATPTYDVWIGTESGHEHIGFVIDESFANLNRGAFAAGSGKMPKPTFHTTLDEAVDAIVEANMPAGPMGLTEPSHWAAGYSFRVLPTRRRARVLARAAEICGTGRAHARAFKQALQEDLTEEVAAAALPDESEFEHYCRAAGGGEIHTTQPDSPLLHPMCRTMDQNNRRTAFITVTAAGPTCRHCIGYREGRAAHRAKQAAA